tara:strand:- start:1309 stop:1725 length:417 start_codon:yes stop_codon:yes gene_type:complete
MTTLVPDLTMQINERIYVSELVDAVADVYNVTREHVMAKVRHALPVEMRALVYHKARAHGITLYAIGRVMGKDHSTVSNQSNKMLPEEARPFVRQLPAFDRTAPYVRCRACAGIGLVSGQQHDVCPCCLGTGGARACR